MQNSTKSQNLVAVEESRTCPVVVHQSRTWPYLGQAWPYMILYCSFFLFQIQECLGPCGCNLCRSNDAEFGHRFAKWRDMDRKGIFFYNLDLFRLGRACLGLGRAGHTWTVAVQETSPSRKVVIFLRTHVWSS